MICKDCGEEVENYYNKSRKMCKKCYSRFQNAKHRNKKYIKLIDLPDNEKSKVISRRTNNSKTYVNSILDYDMKFYEKQKEAVLNDITKCFEKQEAVFPNDYTSLVNVFKQLHILLDNYIGIYFKAEEILNKMESDYKHSKEHFSSLYFQQISNHNYKEAEKIKEKKLIWENRHNILLEFRRNIKNTIVEYNIAGYLFTDLSNDKEFMKKFKNAMEELNNVSNILSEGKYRSEISDDVAKEDFCYGLKENTDYTGKTKYLVSIPTLYNGKRNKNDFSKTVYADNEEDAKQQVIDYINSDKEKFKFVYKQNEIKVTNLNV